MTGGHLQDGAKIILVGTQMDYDPQIPGIDAQAEAVKESIGAVSRRLYTALTCHVINRACQLLCATRYGLRILLCSLGPNLLLPVDNRATTDCVLENKCVHAERRRWGAGGV